MNSSPSAWWHPEIFLLNAVVISFDFFPPHQVRGSKVARILPGSSFASLPPFCLAVLGTFPGKQLASKEGLLLRLLTFGGFKNSITTGELGLGAAAAGAGG